MTNSILYFTWYPISILDLENISLQNAVCSPTFLFGSASVKTKNAFDNV